jgi:hypothetical protein
VVRWIAARQRARQEARERHQLEVVEQEGLVATGMQPAEARRQAEAVAEAMVEQAAQIKDSGLVDDALVEEVETPAQTAPPIKSPATSEAPPMAEIVAPPPSPPAAAESESFAEPLPEPEPAPSPPRPRPRVDVRQVYAAAVKPPRPRRRSPLWPELRDKLLGPGGRFGIGGILLCVGVAGLYFGGVADELRTLPLAEAASWETIARQLVLPRPIVGAFTLEPLTALAAAVAGLMLALSSFQPLRWRTLVHYGGAIVMVVGPWLGVPALDRFDAALVSFMLGGTPMLVMLVLASLQRPE